MPRLIPVVDLKGGKVVRGVAGRRDEYQPFCTPLTASQKVIDIAKAMLEAADANELYVADLDAMATGVLSECVLRMIEAIQCNVLLDAGSDLSRLTSEVRSGTSEVKPTETSCLRIDFGNHKADFRSHFWRLEHIIPTECGLPHRQHYSPRNIVSLDLFNGHWWNAAIEEPVPAVVQCLHARGCRRFIVLDVAAVGMPRGPATLSLCRELRSSFADIELITGGGFRDDADLHAAGLAGIDAVLVSSMLHGKAA
jgi:phosphoribosylformimino-5-aminoimidazole carboxamide ribotide isomerase